MTEHRILRHQIKGRIPLSDGERKALAEIVQELEALVVCLAQENRSCGTIGSSAPSPTSDTRSVPDVGHILKRHGLPPAPARMTTTTWKEFIRPSMDVLVATDGRWGGW